MATPHDNPLFTSEERPTAGYTKGQPPTEGSVGELTGDAGERPKTVDGSPEPDAKPAKKKAKKKKSDDDESPRPPTRDQEVDRAVQALRHRFGIGYHHALMELDVSYETLYGAVCEACGDRTYPEFTLEVMRQTILGEYEAELIHMGMLDAGFEVLKKRKAEGLKKAHAIGL